MIGNINLFWATRKLTQAREDHLTEFVAALIASDPVFRQEYIEKVLAAQAAKLGWHSTAIAQVETQVNYPGTDCCPDMRVTMHDGHVVLCKHKIEATETVGSEADPRQQLTRYLDLPVDGLVYFRASRKPLHDSVVNHSKYIRPHHTEREHFLWADLHSALQRSETDLGQWMRDAFKRLGYTPAHPALGDLTPGSPDFAASRENFFKLVEPIRTFAKTLGWSPVKGPLADIWLQASPDPSVHTIRIDVTANLLNIKIVPSDDAHLAPLKSRLLRTLETETLPVTCEEDSCSLPDRRADSFTISVPVADLLGQSKSVEDIRAALRSHACKYIAAATMKRT